MERAINDQRDHKDAGRPVINWRHPRVDTVLIAIIAWFVLAAWWFASGGLTDYLLVIVSGFIFVVVGLQLILLRVGRADPGACLTGKRTSTPGQANLGIVFYIIERGGA